jgi:hypothetical protein
MFDLGPQFTCLANLPVCIGGWLDGLPFLYVLLAGVVIGMILGSILGKVGVAAVLALAGMFAIWRKVDADEPDYDVPDEDKKPPAPTKPKKRKPIFGN